MLPSFDEVFEALTGYPPREYQERLARRMVGGDPPRMLSVPTGMGKTLAVLVGWLYALAADATEAKVRKRSRRVALRLFLVVDRRAVVDDTHSAAREILHRLNDAGDGPLVQFRRALQQALDLDADDPVLSVHRLRGGLLADDAVTELTRHPARPAIIIGTLDMTMSRLLFRGYGLSASRRSVDAALAGADAWWVLDEAHLAVQARTTLDVLAAHESALETRFGGAVPPLRVMAMTATPGDADDCLALHWADEEARDASLSQRRRNRADVSVELRRAKGDPAPALVAAAQEVLPGLGRGESLVVFANTVERAKTVFEKLSKKGKKPENGARAILLIGGMPARLSARIMTVMEPYRTGAPDRADAAPLLVVATSTLEAGADLDFTHLVTDACSADSLTQRLGRVNRVGARSDGSVRIVATDKLDPVHGEAAARTAELVADCTSLGEALERLVTRAADPELRRGAQEPALLPPTVLRSYARTAGSRNDLPVSPWIRALQDPRAEAVVVVRRCLVEIIASGAEVVGDYLDALPPDRREEGWSVSLGSARGIAQTALKSRPVIVIPPTGEDHEVLEGAGQESRIAPGSVVLIDAAVADAAIGVPGAGEDLSGCAIHSAADVASDGWTLDDALSKAAADPHRTPIPAPTARWRRRSPALLVDLSQGAGNDPLSYLEDMAADLTSPDHRILNRRILAESSGRPWLLLELVEPAQRQPHRQVGLDAHLTAVGALAGRWARSIGLPTAVAEDLELAGRLHDEGKRRSRAFQMALAATEDVHGHLLLAPEPTTALAKSSLPPSRWSRAGVLAGVPTGWRHEASSAEALDEQVADGTAAPHDTDLVRHLILTHHGAFHGPGPVMEPHEDRPAYQDPESSQWAASMTTFWRLVDTYGPYTLALAETILRLADWEVSRREQTGEH